ncbi:MAG: hypothetical protein GC157_18510 [Frankiales bacterium]|nr:hypothetical protein [Frankiales bacterium]
MDSAVPPSTCSPCSYIRIGVQLGRRLSPVDPRHEPGIGSLIVGFGSLFHAERGWVTARGQVFAWPEITAPNSRATSDRALHVAYTTTPIPGGHL